MMMLKYKIENLNKNSMYPIFDRFIYLILLFLVFMSVTTYYVNASRHYINCVDKYNYQDC